MSFYAGENGAAKSMESILEENKKLHETLDNLQALIVEREKLQQIERNAPPITLPPVSTSPAPSTTTPTPTREDKKKTKKQKNRANTAIANQNGPAKSQRSTTPTLNGVHTPLENGDVAAKGDSRREERGPQLTAPECPNCDQPDTPQLEPKSDEASQQVDSSKDPTLQPEVCAPPPEVCVPPPEVAVSQPEVASGTPLEAAVDPQEEVSDVPEPEVCVVPEPEVAVVPQPEVSGVPQPEVSVVADAAKLELDKEAAQSRKVKVMYFTVLWVVLALWCWLLLPPDPEEL